MIVNKKYLTGGEGTIALIVLLHRFERREDV